ncbi:jg12175 [Pararge aegeria aegeria]|uniref:Jg12175 protein n=1 Tax=Pararge aegeria aegeria TaxID=348720 RepID=A0A8S4RS21_9NEOP|nr:jg12175 [Pararge aegeria aegeria]
MVAEARVDCFYATMSKRCGSLVRRLRESTNRILKIASRGLFEEVPKFTVRGCLFPAAQSYSFGVVCRPTLRLHMQGSHSTNLAPNVHQVSELAPQLCDSHRTEIIQKPTTILMFSKQAG